MTDRRAHHAKPMLRIVSGNPTPEELAALTALVTAASSGAADDAPKQCPAWWLARSGPACSGDVWFKEPNAWRSSGW